MKDLNETKTFLPYKLQFFAEDPTPTPEPTPEPEPAPTPDPTPEPTPEPKLTAEEQISLLLAKVKVLESKSDKAATDAADWKKKYRETLDSKAQLDLEKAERDAQREAEFQELKKESAVNKFEKNYITLGYDAKLAKQAAEAQYSGDNEELFRIKQLHQTNLMKKLESEWMKKAPTPPAGNQDQPPEDPFLRGLRAKY